MTPHSSPATGNPGEAGRSGTPASSGTPARSGIDVRRAGTRFRTLEEGRLDSRHSFSFSQHFDPENTHFGLLLACNEEVLAPGAGFDTHPHRETEIVTWVLAGALAHEDSAGHRGELRPGQVQRMSAGSGVRHSERNASATEPVHYVQMWLAPDVHGGEPGYAQREAGGRLESGGWTVLASGRPRDEGTGAIGLRQRGAALHAARLGPGGSLPLPAGAAYLHLLVARGEASLDGGGSGAVRLAAGDAVRVRRSPEGLGVTAAAGGGAELLAWEMDLDLRDLLG